MNVVAYSAGTRPDYVSLSLAACYSKLFDSPLVKTVNVGALPKHKTNPVVHNFLLEVMKPSRYKYTYGYMVAAQFDHDSKTDEIHAVALYNYEAYHTAAISLNMVDNALLKHFVGTEYSIVTENAHIRQILSKRSAEKKKVSTLMWFSSTRDNMIKTPFSTDFAYCKSGSLMSIYVVCR